MAIRDKAVRTEISGKEKNSTSNKKRVSGDIHKGIEKWLAIIPKLLTVIDVIIRLIEHITQI